jgi:hypothetical protein
MSDDPDQVARLILEVTAAADGVHEKDRGAVRIASEFDRARRAK